MSHTLASQPLVNDTCNVLAVTIVVSAARSELMVTVDHSPEYTRNEDGEPRTITSRTFRRRVACPAEAARRMVLGTYIRHPEADVNVSYA